MSTLTLVSSHPLPLKPLVGSALRKELRLWEAGIRRSTEKIAALEQRHDLATSAFVQRYENDEMEETLELAEWIGEQRLLARLEEKAQTLRELQFAD